MFQLCIIEAEEQYRDMTKAIQYYQEAVDKGHYGAMNNLGVCYKEEDGVPLDFEKAFQLFKKAADGGDYHAFMNLARAYTYGQGTKIDLEQAQVWCQKAVEKEIDGASELLLEISEKAKKKKGFSIFKRH